MNSVTGVKFESDFVKQQQSPTIFFCTCEKDVTNARTFQNNRLQVAYTHAQVRPVENRQTIRTEWETENHCHVTTWNDTGEKVNGKSVSQN